MTYGENTPGTQTEGQATLKLSTGSSGKATRQNGLRAVADHHDETLEKNFHMVQIMTACYMSFAHGAGDVSNAAGPLVAIWAAYSAGAVNKVRPVFTEKKALSPEVEPTYISWFFSAPGH